MEPATVTDLVKRDLDERTLKGTQTYGEPLRCFNGRDALQDAYEEALDLAQYLKQALLEKGDEGLHWLETAVIRWAGERNIFEGSTPLQQLSKTREEVDELEEAIKKGISSEAVDAIGDIIVTLIIIHWMLVDELGLETHSTFDCLKSAYDQIKHRKGRMINGVFVKEEDLNEQGLSRNNTRRNKKR